MVATLQAPAQVDQLQVGNTREPGDFSDSEFFNIPNVPVFSEHETKAQDGREISFGYEQLKLVADRCNRRIAESGDYAAVCIGHTPSPEAKAAGSPDPKVVGFAGPFRMGVIGQPNTRQRSAILADFHIFRDCVNEFKRHPRRSAELWLEDSYDEMFLDPIALLGAEAPRLDLGLLYSAELHRGTRIVRREKYSAAVMPGSSNAFVPGADCKTRQPYQGDNPMLDENAVAQIAEAISNTDEWQFIRKLMSENAGNVAGGEAAADAGPPPVAPAVPSPAPEPNAPVAEGGEASNDPPPNKNYEALDAMNDDEIEQYMSHRKRRYEAGSNASGEYQTADQSEMGSKKIERSETTGAPTPYQAGGSIDGESSNPSSDSSVDGTDSVGDASVDADGEPSAQSEPYAKQGETLQYQRLQVELRKMQDDNKQIREELQTERYSRANAVRRQRLQELQLNGFALDPDKEMERLDSRSVNDKQFEANITSITENYQRVPTMELPSGRGSEKFDMSRPGSSNERAQYSKKCSERALQVCKQLVEDGQEPSFENVLAEVEAGKHGEIV